MRASGNAVNDRRVLILKGFKMLQAMIALIRFSLAAVCGAWLVDGKGALWT